MPLVGIDVKGAGEAVGSLVSGVGDLALKLRTAFTGKDPQAEVELQKMILTLEVAGQAAQAKINEIEAANPRLFIAGARPAILWLCALILLYSYVAYPILRACGVALPEIQLGDLWPVLTGLLGIAGLRTYEKAKGVQGNH